jgi:hypothetical protein
MMLAELSPGEIIADLIACGLFIVALVALLKKQQVQLDQPLLMKMVEALVTKAEFDKRLEKNDEIHEQLFSKIGGVERGGRSESEKQVTELRRELNSTNGTMHELKGEMKQLTSQLVLIQQELAKDRR